MGHSVPPSLFRGVERAWTLLCAFAMRLLIDDPEGKQATLDVPEGRATLGGLASDALQVEGLTRECARMTREASRLMLEPLTELSVNGIRSPPGVARLVEGHDRVALPGGFVATLLCEPPKTTSRSEGTASLLRDFLADRTQVGSAAVPSVICLTGLDVGKRFALTEARMTVGRGEDASLRIRERSVSRRHARLTRKGTELTIEDLASPNGVLVNGTRIGSAQRVVHGDVVELGNALLRVCIPAPSLASTAAVPPADNARNAEARAEAAVASPPAPAQIPTSSETLAELPGEAEGATDLVTDEERLARPKRSSAWSIVVGCMLTILGVVVTYGLVFAN